MSNIQKVIYKIGIKYGVILGGKGDEADELDSPVAKEAQAYKEKNSLFLETFGSNTRTLKKKINQ